MILSEQELCDCDRTYNSGCGGGLMDYAYKWVIKNHGIDSEDDYPYKAVENTCIKNKVALVLHHCSAAMLLICTSFQTKFVILLHCS